MFQIIFNDVSAAEMAEMPKPLQLEVLSQFNDLTGDFDFSRAGDNFGELKREGECYYRFRAKDYRIYFQKTESGLLVRRVLHKNTLKDFLFRTKLPTGEDEALQKDPNFWKLIDGSEKKD